MAVATGVASLLLGTGAQASGTNVYTTTVSIARVRR
jgi:hypothetical protein